jgi:hypothetical protein
LWQERFPTRSPERDTEGTGLADAVVSVAGEETA